MNKNILFPSMEADKVSSISFKRLFDKGIRGIIFDIDNTLVKHGYPADKETLALFEHIHEIGLKTCLLSNNKESRVKPFADSVDTIYIYKAGKPCISGYIKAMNMMDTDRHSTVFIGDQIFTDIIGANRVGIKTILVEPIDPHEEVQIILKRIPERIILAAYHRVYGGKA